MAHKIKWSRFENFGKGSILSGQTDIKTIFSQLKEVKGQAVLGSDDFVDWLYERFLSKERLDRGELAGVKDLQPGPSTLEEIARRISQELGVEEEAFYRRREIPQARSVFMELCRLYLRRRMSLAEMGRKLGGVSASASSQNRKRLEAALEEDPLLRQSFRKLSKGLASDDSQSLGFDPNDMTPISLALIPQWK